MLDKLLLNNQIITNKKKIQKGRIQTINKLVQKIRQLKALKEKKPDNAKITENLEKKTKIMACAKKIKIVDIIRQILTLSKKPAAILTNGQAPPEEIALALLASNKIIIEFITTLRTLLHLDVNSNPKWKEEIMELSKRKKKLLQNGDRKKTRKAEKSLKKPVVKMNPWKEEPLPIDDSKKSVDDGDVVPAIGWKVEPITDTTEKSSPSIKPKPVVKPETIKENIHSTLPNESFDETPESPQKRETTVDSFFFTSTGDNYISTAVIDRIQPDGPDDGLVRRERRDNAMRPYQRRNNNYTNDKRKPVQNGRMDKRQRFPTPSISVKAQPADEKLHPSWAAKQKLKPTIAQFKGQKITFGDDGVENAVKSSEKNSSKLNFKVKNTAKAQTTDDKLHPSWAAKQKLKPAITEFKGKKITFDD